MPHAPRLMGFFTQSRPVSLRPRPSAVLRKADVTPRKPLKQLTSLESIKRRLPRTPPYRNTVNKGAVSLLGF